MTLYRRAIRIAVIFAVSIAGQSAGATEQKCSRQNFQNCLNGVSSSVTNGGGLRVAGAEYDDVARKRSGRSAEKGTASLFSPSRTLAAGDDIAGGVFALWGSYSFSDFDSDFAFQGTSLAFDADAHNVLAGFDRLFADRFLLGLAFGYQWVDSETDFNGGGQENDGFIVAPYAAVLLNDIFSVDLMGGYSPLEYDQDRISPADATDISASFDADRWFVAANVNAFVSLGNWVLSAKIGYLYTEEKQDAYTETGSALSAAGVGGASLRSVAKRNIDLTQIIAGAEVGYSFGAFEPYAMVAFHEELDRDDDESAGGLPGNFTSVQPDDDDEVQFGGGIRYYTEWGLSTSLEYSRVEGRQDFDSQTVMFILRAAL